MVPQSPPSLSLPLSLSTRPYLKAFSKRLKQADFIQKVENEVINTQAELAQRLCTRAAGNVPVTKGSKRVNRKCKLDADKGNGYTTRVTTLFPPSESKVKTPICLTVWELNDADENRTRHGKCHQASLLSLKWSFHTSKKVLLCLHLKSHLFAL